jgi:hypothetical protein
MSDDLARQAAHLREPQTCQTCDAAGTVHLQQVCDRHGIRELEWRCDACEYVWRVPAADITE